MIRSLAVCSAVQPEEADATGDAIVERVLQQLKDLGRVPRDFVRSQVRRPAVWTLSRTTSHLVGREYEVKAVLDSLRQHGAAVLWGGPARARRPLPWRLPRSCAWKSRI